MMIAEEAVMKRFFLEGRLFTRRTDPLPAPPQENDWHREITNERITASLLAQTLELFARAISR